MEIPDISPDLIRDTEPQTSFTFTRYTILAAILASVKELRWWNGGDSIVFREDGGEEYYEFRFRQEKLAEEIKDRFEKHVSFVKSSPDHWLARVLDVFHNRQRLLEIADGPPCRIRRHGRRIYTDPKPGPEFRRNIVATDGQITFDKLELIALLLAHDELPLERQQPLTMAESLRRFNFQNSARFNKIIETYYAPERFIANNPEHWLSYAIAALLNYGNLVHQTLPKLDLQRLSHRRVVSETGPARITTFAKPITKEQAHAEN